jgi:hypothetical protein
MKSTIHSTLTIGILFIGIGLFTFVDDWYEDGQFQNGIQAFNRVAIGATFIIISQGFRLVKEKCFDEPQREETDSDVKKASKLFGRHSKSER